MKLNLIIQHLENYAPLNYQEDYDNSGLIVGNGDEEITGAIVSLDCTEAVVDEAIRLGYNLVISHHPIVFKGLKKFNNKNYVSRVVIKAIQNNIALYAIHTNLDHVQNGVNSMICRKIGLENTRILAPKQNLLRKIVTYAPTVEAEGIRNALFNVGAGEISNYSECSFSTKGIGTFNGNENTNPTIGTPGFRTSVEEEKIELIYKVQDERKIITNLLETHSYEEVAYEIYPLINSLQNVGAGMIGELAYPVETHNFLEILKETMNCKVIRHTKPIKKMTYRIAVCGGAGGFLLNDAIKAGADVFITADYKYHEFFDADGKIMIADIGHFETEQFTIDLLIEIINEKFRNFAVRKTEHITNPINYFI